MLLPNYFVFSKVHYARYGRFYIYVLENLETAHPGTKEELKQIGISVQKTLLKLGGELMWLVNRHL